MGKEHDPWGGGGPALHGDLTPIPTLPSKNTAQMVGSCQVSQGKQP